MLFSICDTGNFSGYIAEIYLMHRACHTLVLYLILHWTEPKTGDRQELDTRGPDFKLTAWSGHLHGFGQTMLLRPRYWLHLHSTVLKSQVMFLIFITEQQKNYVFLKGKGNPAKRYCCYLLALFSPLLFLMALGTAWNSVLYDTALLYLKFHFMALVDRLKIHYAVTALT